jgi:hypothetical protein
MTEAMLLANLIPATFMCGVIWFVQVVHYPLFAYVGDGAAWHEYHNRHARQTTWVVAPVMLVEAMAAAWWVYTTPGTASILAASVLGVVWLSTFLLQVPLHGQLAHGFSKRSVGRLVIGNWIRTAGWTLRPLWIAAAFIVGG